MTNYDLVSSKVALVVISCDNYSDLWKPFFKCLNKFWPDCPFKVYLMSNQKECDESNVVGILTHDDPSWSDSVIKGISQIKEEYIFMYLDDLFLTKTVDTPQLMKVIKWGIENDINYLRTFLMTNNKPDKACNELVGELSKNAIYRASTVMPIWKKSVLLDLLKEGESAWQFEIHGTVRADKYDKFYATWFNYLNICNTVIKGKWRRAAVREIQDKGISIDLDARQVMSFSETIRFNLLLFRSRVLSFAPVSMRRMVKVIMTKLGIRVS